MTAKYFFTGLTLATLALGGPQAMADGMEMDDLYKIKQVGQVSISPDGEHVAYTRSVQRDPYNDDNGPTWSELHMATDEGESRTFIGGKVNIGAIDWRPDGKAISFLAKREGDDQRSLYVIPVDGGEAERVLSHETAIRSYSWHPDGERVAFLATEAKDEDRTKLEDKGFNARVIEERLRPVAVWTATAGDKDSIEQVELEGSASELHWSPAGDKLAMMIAPTPLVDDDLMFRKPQVVDADNGDVVATFDVEGKLGPMAWSPDGEYLAWVGADDIHDPREGRLVVGDVQSGSVETIKGREYLGHVQTLDWDSDDSIIWMGHRGTYSELGRIHRDGNEEEILIDQGQPILRSLSLADDGSLAFAADSPDHPRELYVHQDGELDRWTDNNPWLADRELAEQEVVTHEARDGLELEGVLIRPLNERRRGGHPMIMAVHGGPEAHISNGWNTNYSDPGQVAAAQGYAVFYPNYRGSTARGVEFTKLGQADAAGAEFDDLVDAKDHLVETGLVDEDQVGITGGSYGGYASAWGATALTEHFAASVMFVGISNTISKFGTSDIPQELMLVHARKWPWDDWEFALERSPIYHAENAETPILIMHGEADTRVHVSQSMELYRTLKVQDNVPVRMVTFPGEGHGNRNATSQREYTMRLMRWMDHFVRDGSETLPEADLDHGDKL
ncbi:dipeptidyl aminopeptidase/acylaminoacyl peptidase [Natronospira proteinivora]|uniref:Dipeptidyl aminopeptidase/acylaminoacyl peptidase n=1 Tax=Natronospira proteinivora TaxID=1807133 RepID=A0ABT1G7Y7_9GAMM|nr:S9 family peptidase [Natronospira proteinivora]MCP1727336.1 dipeptidyl aminopeptidase/acylaminoacyl peptidase [Natronospira proteinivora]